MTQILFVEHDGSEHAVEAENGVSLMQAANLGSDLVFCCRMGTTQDLTPVSPTSCVKTLNDKIPCAVMHPAP